jgi:hypothetical protein
METKPIKLKRITIPHAPILTKTLVNGIATLNAEDVKAIKRTLWGMAWRGWKRRQLYAIILMDGKPVFAVLRGGMWEEIHAITKYTMEDMLETANV